MSRFFSNKYQNLEPYTPGEQPKSIKKLIKLNTNESPFMPSKKAIKYGKKAIRELMLYPDPTAEMLHKKFAELIGVSPDEVLATNGSDEILNFAFMAFCDKNTPAVFPDITYGFYKVFAEVNGIEYKEIPLKDDFTINIEDYKNAGGTIFIANPNAPTGIALNISQIEEILKANPENIVVVDEAYVDFGAESAVNLIKSYDNLLVTMTFSKSRSMAGARLGFGIGNKELIRDLNTIKYSTNPYNINRVTMVAGIGAIEDESYTRKNIETIVKNRTYTEKKLQSMGFELTDSKTNFIFTRHPKIGGKEIYLKLKDAGIIVRHFDKEKISEYNRITIGTKKQMDVFLSALEKIIKR